jgi:TonB family protein
MYKPLFLLSFCLLFVGCFALTTLNPLPLTSVQAKKQEEAIAKATTIYYNAQIMADYPKVYMSYYNELTTQEFASYIAYAKETEQGIMLDFKDADTGKTHCLAYYKDKTLQTQIEWRIFDDNQRLKILKKFDVSSTTITEFDTLQAIKSFTCYENYALKNSKFYYPTGELQYANDYTKNGEITTHTETKYRKDKTKICTATTIGKDDKTKICFDEKDKVIDCKNDEPPFNEIKPEFPGGEAALMTFLANNIKYPKIARENGREGKVFVKFIVNKTGEVEYIVPIRYPDIYLMRETVRVIKTSPKWTPGEQDGKPVRVQYTLPVIFKLD